MTHAFTLPAADPIHAAIVRHRAAYQVAPEGRPSVEANDEYDAASEAIVTTACTTRFGALALLEHFRWWLREEAAFKAGHQPAYGIAEARAADLTLFLGTNLPPVPLHRAAPQGRLAPPLAVRPVLALDLQRRDTVAALHDERLPGEIELWEAVQAVRPDTAHVRAPRFLDLAGELLTAVLLIARGVAAHGFLPIA
ncbi:hypothetical protein Q8W71_32095 [Methylobacterium sp. NEAU 140]|uniref:hypothetical protein n=1 Tax=Methylobacterium sp. NEAU 140 TaxID=3064945 RepID=UPI0027374ABA|nr:hypothetical protein [Methylobacterium sp. NEAU 140]MDP4027217.1 hypothetical protein [Methylobacterium sp. NEAU 140]